MSMLTRIVPLLMALLAGCANDSTVRVVPPAQMSMEQIAEGYVKLVLAYGQIEPGYVDAYYGPAEWPLQAEAEGKSVLAIRNVLAKLQHDIGSAPLAEGLDPALGELRRSYLRNQLGALAARIRMHEGWKPSFDDEAVALYDIEAPLYDSARTDAVLAQLDHLLPGEGELAQRYNRYMDQFNVPASRLDAVMRLAIDEARAVSLRHLPLPPGEQFELAWVSKQPWSAYNWYQGELRSRIEINTDLPVTPSRVIQLAVHEGYPGHHVYNAALEQKLRRDLGWIEFSVYPLFSPQSFIAEGSADFGMALAFPVGDRQALLRKLFRSAGLPVEQVETYDLINELGRKLGAAHIEAARAYRDGRMDREQTIAWLQTYALLSPERARQRLDFIDRYGAYIINYAYGEEVVRGYVERMSGTSEPDERQWQVYWTLISTPRTPHATFAN